MTDKRQYLTRFHPGFYVDAEGALYIHLREFLIANNLPDAPEVRAVILEEVRREFEDEEITELPD